MQPGIITLSSRLPVPEILARVKSLLAQRGIRLFCVVDHSGEAAAAGLSMPDTKLLIFGNPKAGTPVMLASPGAALDLPLKLLIAETPEGAVLSWNDPAWLQERHGFPAELTSNLGAVEALARTAVSA